ncbi:AI-2E family transporter [Desulfonatronovibrio magnus]|uniref:AI-2E family transporter n=1 Tax=Desulfonatronovibrio magnus TaxID=698827 RepID=UPI0005EBC4AD|nr:AI-2E family transporter [Desulfonatronovibrio magnus]
MANQDNLEFFSPFQRKVLSYSLVTLGLALIAAFILVVFFSLRWIVTYFSEILWPLAIAGILALLLRPIVLWLQHRLRAGRMASIAVLYFLMAVFLVLITALILPVVLTQAQSFIQYFPVLLENLGNFLRKFLPYFSGWVDDFLDSTNASGFVQGIFGQLQDVYETSRPALGTIGDFLGNFITLAVGVVIIPVYLFFFLLADKDPVSTMEEQLSFIPKSIREDFAFLAREFARIVVAFFRGQIVIGLIMGVLMAIGFSLSGLKFGAFLGIIIGLLNIIPYLGSILGLLIVLPLSYFQEGGGLILLIMVLGVFAAVQVVESYLLTPRIMGKSTGLHPLAIIVAVLFWGKAFGGILGMILAIPLTAFFVVAWRLARKKYLQPSAGQ